MPKPTRVTMKDVAAEAGVSQSTVSFVLGGATDMRIAPETARRVEAAAERLGYARRPAGRPRSASVPVIGLMLDEIATSPFAAISVEGMQERAWAEGALVEVVMSGGSRAYERAALARWQEAGVAGVVYGSILTRRVEPPAALGAMRAVLLNCYDADGRLPAVVPDERGGGAAAARLLVEAGHRAIAFIGGEDWMDAARERRAGFEGALAEAGLAPVAVEAGNFLLDGGREAARRLIASGARFDALFCASDRMAAGAYAALMEAGLIPGRDVGVMGYDDLEIAQRLDPPLTTVLLPHREMGQWAAEAVLSSRPLAHGTVRLDCPVVARASHLS